MSPGNESTACGDTNFDFLVLAEIIPVNDYGGSPLVTGTCDARHAEGTAGGDKARAWKKLVELVGIEPTASSLRTTRSPN